MRLARVYYGEFGLTERAAVMDVIGAHPDSRGRQVGAALIDQLRTNRSARDRPHVPWVR